ncbi:2-isopropylmalate synthase [Poriferisphaera sp. WC338]|uniref:2-isopropylmalate synthase n=1 Tax=Poriferisphaera sp. WC338 TaxID=3425129 RepID=UPI003D8151F5
MATNQDNTDKSPEQTRIRIFDTTLRDGEQSPGASLNFSEKFEIARQLELLGVDVVEAGFPITSQGDFEAVRAISQELERTTVAGLARCVPRDIDRAGEAVKDGKNSRIHVFCATSKIHREHKLKKAFEQIVELASKSVAHARQYTDDVEFSPEDGSRTELNYLVDVTAAVIEAGATTINIPDTVGYATPAEYGRIFSYVREQLPVIDEKGIILSSHCHNDLGLAVANSIAAIQNGAKQIECTINGIGERAGNAALEEIVMALNTRSDVYNFATNIDTKRIYPVSRMVSNLTGLHVQRNKAIVGENAFAHESGIHQDGMLKNRNTYEIMNPHDIGVPESKLVLGKHSGRHALKDRVIDLGYTVDEAMLDKVYDAFKTLADKKKDVYDEDIEAILDEQLESQRQLWELARFQISSGTGVISTATVVLRDSSGAEKMDAATGDGPIDACYEAIQRITGVVVKLEQYQTRAITGGKDAQGEVSVQITHRERKVRGRAFSTDVIEAAVRAYLAAINRIKLPAEEPAPVDQP